MPRSTRSMPPGVPENRIPVLPIHLAKREAAQAEFNRAERAVEALASIVAWYRRARSALQRTFTVHRQRHG